MQLESKAAAQTMGGCWGGGCITEHCINRSWHQRHQGNVNAKDSFSC